MRVPGFGFLSARTARLAAFDVLRLRARLVQGRRSRPAASRLHLGSGRKRVPGWLNVDVMGSEHDIDLACGRLPWPDASFSAVVCQHVIEHLELEDELLPLLREVHRVLRPDGELWLSCPDLEKVCRAYVEDRAAGLAADRRQRMPLQAMPPGIPSQHFVNWLFHQRGEHKNLFDFDLLAWALAQAGFASCVRVNERDLLARYPEMPPRHDDMQSLAVLAHR
jgi:predicted SAM-dependent methyltransferase